MREVTVDGRTTFQDVEPPEGRWPVAAVEGGLLFQSDTELELWDPTTHTFTDSLPGAFPVATWREMVVSCQECHEVWLTDLTSGATRTVDLPEDIARIDGYGGVFSPDGRFVAVPGFDRSGPTNNEVTVSLLIIDVENASARVVPGSQRNGWEYPNAAWSRDSRWVFFANGERLLAYRPGDPSAFVVGVELAGPYYGMAAH